MALRHAARSGRKYVYVVTIKKKVPHERLLSRFIMRVGPGTIKRNMPRTVVDHVNGDTLDNRRSNLRVCSQQENLRNRAINVGRQYKGVVYDKTRQGKTHPWIARITVDGRTKYLGVFRLAIAGAFAYDDAARKYYGKFARLNFPDDGEQQA
jgi:hypothetical protein